MNSEMTVLKMSDDFGSAAYERFLDLCASRGCDSSPLGDGRELRIRRVDQETRGSSQHLDDGIHPQHAHTDESYTITGEEEAQTLEILASTENGVFRALCAIAMNPGPASGLIGTHIPVYPWRALSLDVARYQASPSEIESVIDLAALQGLSALHLHLSDHQSWRVPVEGFEALSEGGAFSWADLEELGEYARRRYITIIPEIDMPGHCASLLRTYPELSGRSSFAHPFVSYIDVHQQRSRRFLESCVDSLARIATGPYIHIGGDEVLGMPEQDYDKAITIIGDHARHRGCKVIAWQEACRATFTADAYQYWMADEDIPSEESLLKEWPDEFASVAHQAAVMYAQCRDDLERIRSKGAALIDSRQSYLYLDRRYAERSGREGQNIRLRSLGFPGYEAKDSMEVLQWSPLERSEVAQGGIAGHTDGIEAALWTETVRSLSDMTMLLLPRLSMVSSLSWRTTPLRHSDAPGTPKREQVLTRIRRQLANSAGAWERFGYDDYYRSSSVFDGSAAPRTARPAVDK